MTWRRGQRPGPKPDDVLLVEGSTGETLARLVRWGVIGRVGRHRVVPGDGTYRAVWEHWTAVGCPLPAEIAGTERYRTYRRVKRTLRAKRIPHHPDCMLLEVAADAGAGGVSWDLLSDTLGQPLKGSMRRLGELLGTAPKPNGRARPGTLEDLLAVLPRSTWPAIRAFLEQERIPAIVPPTPEHIGRALAIPQGPVRTLATCLLLAGSGDRKQWRTVTASLADCERYADILPDEAAQVPEAVGRALEGFAAGILRPTDTEWMRHSTALLYASRVNVAHEFAVRVLGTQASLVTSRLPARMSDERSFNAARRARLAELKAPGRSACIEHVKDVVPRLQSILVAVENIVHQLERLVVACLDGLKEAAARLEVGVRAGFEYTGPVVRQDGSLAPTNQTISFRFEREGDLIERAHRRSPDDRTIRDLMPRDEGARHRYGSRHDPEHWRRIHLVYEGTTPDLPGGECVEPSFADLFRWGMLDWEKRLPPSIALERRRRLVEASLPLCPVTVDGLLTASRSRRDVARIARTDDPAKGAIVVPLIEFYHALCYARIVVRYGIRWGARFAETLQLRLGPDCFRYDKIGGVDEIHVALKPKGWVEHGRFGIDDGTLVAIRHAKELSNALWWPGLVNEKGEPWLPVHEFGDPGRRRDLPPAAYLLVGPRGALKPEILQYYVRVILYRILKVGRKRGRHADRVIFATMLGLDGVGYESLGHLLHHSPGSAMPAHYDLSAHLKGSDAARSFNARSDAALIGRISDA